MATRSVSARQMSAANGGAHPPGFWQSLGQLLDTYSAGRRRGALSATTLRRCDSELARCRRLMRGAGAARAFGSPH